MAMNTEAAIKIRTELNINGAIGNVLWSQKIQEKKQIKPPREKGEKPYQCELNGATYSSNFPGLNKKKSAKSSRQQNSDTQINMDSGIQTFSEQNFAQIAPSVREISGGWNTQSNEVIERRHKERQQKYATENINSSTSSDTACTTQSSETTSESYKTANSFDSVITTQQSESEIFVNDCLERYKKNALIIGLLRSAQNEYPDQDESSTQSSDFLDASACVADVENGMSNLNIKENENMRDDRLGRWFQSKEDEDVYYHPLKEEIKGDPEWQKHYLKRRGIETIQTSREYYLNVEDDSFTFQPNVSKKITKTNKR